MWRSTKRRVLKDFNPRPPRGERQWKEICDRIRKDISIHALREESDANGLNMLSNLVAFQSTPSARRATGATIDRVHKGLFQSTPSARRATTRTHYKTGR